MFVFIFTMLTLLLLVLANNLFGGPISYCFHPAGVLIQAPTVLQHSTAASQRQTQIIMAHSKRDSALRTPKLWTHCFSSGHFGWLSGVQLLGMIKTHKGRFLDNFPLCHQSVLHPR